MTGRRKSCKKVAASSLPFMEMSVPAVDGFFYQYSDDEENRTPDFRSRIADARPDPATAGAAAAALCRIEPTSGFRKKGKRKAATQINSFTAVAEQTTQQIGAAAEKNLNNGDGTKKDNYNCVEGSGPKDASGCSYQDASNPKVAVSVTAKLTNKGVM